MGKIVGLIVKKPAEGKQEKDNKQGKPVEAKQEK